MLWVEIPEISCVLLHVLLEEARRKPVKTRGPHGMTVRAIYTIERDEKEESHRSFKYLERFHCIGIANSAGRRPFFITKLHNPPSQPLSSHPSIHQGSSHSSPPVSAKSYKSPPTHTAHRPGRRCSSSPSATPAG